MDDLDDLKRRAGIDITEQTDPEYLLKSLQTIRTRMEMMLSGGYPELRPTAELLSQAIQSLQKTKMRGQG